LRRATAVSAAQRVRGGGRGMGDLPATMQALGPSRLLLSGSSRGRAGFGCARFGRPASSRATLATECTGNSLAECACAGGDFLPGGLCASPCDVAYTGGSAL
jgi:hypothetical protein